MKLNILNARIKRNNLKKYAGHYFRNNDSQIVNTLKNEGKSALVGIQREDGVYTILGEKKIFYSTSTGKEKEMSLELFSDELHTNAMNKGKGANYEFLQIDNGEFIWLNNESTMTSLWNTILLLEKLY